MKDIYERFFKQYPCKSLNVISDTNEFEEYGKTYEFATNKKTVNMALDLNLFIKLVENSVISEKEKELREIPQVKEAYEKYCMMLELYK